jgi:sodium/bile acid cotransporter 7
MKSKRQLPILLSSCLLLLISTYGSAFTSCKRPQLVPTTSKSNNPRILVDEFLPRDGTVVTTRVLTSLRGGNDSASTESSRISKIATFANTNFFLLGMLVAVSLAKAFPSLGKNGGLLRPELFIGKFGVTLIFLLSGLSLEASELTKAAANVKLNGLIQLVIFGAWPLLVGLPLKWAISTLFPTLMPPALVDGLLILTCLPTTINMCIMLTSAGGGNVATSICNAIISNLAGIFATPALLFRFFGAQIQLPFLQMVTKLCNMVLLPVGKFGIFVMVISKCRT